PCFFPIAVWLQSPANAARYKALGFNTYVGLWKGPTEAQLAQLRAAGMRVICQMNEIGLAHIDDPLIIGWMHGDEPDNAQPDPNGGYGPPIPPAQVIRDYEGIRHLDPSRPVLLNLGQGVAWDGWYGRGVRTGHPEDYLEYAKAADIISFDIYPANSDNLQVKDRLWLVAFGVDRLIQWTNGQKVIWNCIECTKIGQQGRRPSPQEVKAEVWMSIIHGSRGLIYFVHVFAPRFIEAGLLADPEMSQAVSQINRQILELAPVINQPDTNDVDLVVTTSDPNVPVDTMVRSTGLHLYIFAVAMRNYSTMACFKIDPAQYQPVVDVLAEGRNLRMDSGTFSDRFDPYAVHIYRLARSAAP
ncbi:MAG: hypothetical protein QHH07_03305, partial [Sedimentisphaerales bacterium]|nr:hypothetical protein [Sedimentisphaerales bacterium]